MHPLICLLVISGVSSTLFQFLPRQTTTQPPTHFLQQNATCRSQTFTDCFEGTCASGYACLNDNRCCPNQDIDRPPSPECEDKTPFCATLSCAEAPEFAQAYCASTCHLCDSGATLAPRYRCVDILDDCKNRTNSGMCNVGPFMDMMAVYCPLSCDMCTYSNPATSCGNLIARCDKLGQKFCTSDTTSAFQLRAGCGQYCNQCN